MLENGLDPLPVVVSPLIGRIDGLDPLPVVVSPLIG